MKFVVSLLFFFSALSNFAFSYPEDSTGSFFNKPFTRDEVLKTFTNPEVLWLIPRQTGGYSIAYFRGLMQEEQHSGPELSNWKGLFYMRDFKREDDQSTSPPLLSEEGLYTYTTYNKPTRLSKVRPYLGGLTKLVKEKRFVLDFGEGHVAPVFVTRIELSKQMAYFFGPEDEQIAQEVLQGKSKQEAPYEVPIDVLRIVASEEDYQNICSKFKSENSATASSIIRANRVHAQLEGLKITRKIGGQPGISTQYCPKAVLVHSPNQIKQ